MKDDRLNLYKSLFKGREDVFALRWEKGGKSSYMPVYNFDPHRYRLHQMKGGTFQTFADKTYQSLTDDHLIKHRKGERVIGLYPLLQDNTSWFIAADFDEANWIEECRTFIKICEEYDIPAYLERSRSGKGGHVAEGYDIASFNDESSIVNDRFIEVKSFNGQPYFFWSRNEIDIARIKKNEYYLYLVNRDKMVELGYAPIIIQNPYAEVLLNEGHWNQRVEKIRFSLKEF